MPIAFIHLSDIHFGQEKGGAVAVHDDVKERLIEDVQDQVARLPGQRASGVIVCGDIAYAGKREQYAAAAAWLDQIAGAAGCAKTDVQMVPGNHDVDRAKISAALTWMLEEIKVKGEAKLDEFFEAENDRTLLYSRFQQVEPSREEMQMNLATACASSDEQVPWDSIDWSKVHRHVRRLQARIVKAWQVGDHGKVKALQWLLTHSYSGRALAVKRVTDNRGKRTPGVDGMIWSTPGSLSGFLCAEPYTALLGKEGRMAKKDAGPFTAELLDSLLAGRDPKTILDSGGLLGELKKALAERMLNAEMDVHLDGEAEAGLSNHRNGSSPKTVLTPEGAIELSIPRDRHGRFDPALIAKYRRRFPDFDDKIIALYARGMSTRDIQAHVRELYGIEVSPVTDSVIDEVTAWQARPLESTYAIVFFDALRVKIRDEGLVRNKAVYLAIGMRPSGHKEVLGLWIEQTEGAKFWLRVMNEIRARGTQDILIAVVDGLKGFPEAITAAFPDAVVQTCIVHLIRYSMQFASWKERKAVAAGLKPIYRAESAEAAARELDAFDQGPWGRKYPVIAQSWRRNWEAVIPFFAFPADVRKIIYTTNAIESLNASVRKAIRNKGHFPNDQAATKLIWLALRHITDNWKNPPITWHSARAQLAIQFGERFTLTD